MVFEKHGEEAPQFPLIAAQPMHLAQGLVADLEPFVVLGQQDNRKDQDQPENRRVFESKIRGKLWIFL